MKILLHSCCAPCTIYPLKHLRGEGHEVTGYFYNPNIHPFTEFRARREALEKFAGEEGFPLLSEKQYGLDEYLAEVIPLLDASGAMKEPTAARCAACYRLRLHGAARKAAEMGADAFTTTLSVSPWQNHELICDEGRKAGEAAGVPFLYFDFRPGYRSAQNEARERGIYRQKYCGCIFSEKERYCKTEE